MNLTLALLLGLVFLASALAVAAGLQALAQHRLRRRARQLGRGAAPRRADGGAAAGADAGAGAGARAGAGAGAGADAGAGAGAGAAVGRPPAAAAPRWEPVLQALSRLSLPEGGWQDSRLRLKFVRAGLRSPQAPRLYFAAKTAGTLALPLLAGALLWLLAPQLAPSRLALAVLALAAAGHYLPDAWLRWRTGRRADGMRDVLPDLMDLLVICTESGMGMDAAINRVAQEIALSNRALAEEFYLAALEIRAGAGRAQALQYLALRVHLDDLYGMVSMLVQADKFGTGLAESLRIQSEMMRTKRMQRAEELAAKVPVKMLIPLVLFIFPALLAVLVGPAFIQIAAVFQAQ